MNNAILMSSGADNIDFMIHGIFSYEIFGHTVWITTSHVCILIVMLLMLGLAIAANRTMKHAKEIPEGFQNVLEIMVEKLDAMVYGTMGKVAAPKFVNYISTIFVFILMSNISGLFGLRPPTADYGTTLALGLITFALVYGLLGKIAIIWPAALHVYFDLFSGAIQTYVFCMLTMTYISQNYETE